MGRAERRGQTVMVTFACVVQDPKRRATADQVLQHPWMRGERHSQQRAS